MKKVIAIFLGVLTLCQSFYGIRDGSTIGVQTFYPAAEHLHQHYTDNIDTQDPSLFESTLCEQDHEEQADELYVYASAVCTTHTYGAFTVTRAATCTTSGSKTRTCTKCGTTDTDSIPALGHMFGGSVYAVPASCTSGGYNYNLCSRCSAQNRFNISSALGHSYSQIVSTPTCVTAGSQKCSRCGSTTTIPATGVHSYTVTTVAATCTSGGTKRCANCTATQATAALGHAYGGSVYTVPATCTAGGYSYNLCSRCDAKNKFNLTSSLGHNYSVITKEATCVTAGTKKCSRCTSTTSIPATGVHNYTVTSVAATCTNGGTKKCANCTATQSTSALGHMFGGSTYTVPATCTAGGYTYNLCSRCNAQNKLNTTSALGHNYTDITNAATCITAGTKKCSRCTSTTSIPATGVHSYTVTSLAATCTTAGTSKCATCTATQSISAMGHSYGGQTYVVPSSCLTGGYSYNLCIRCNTENRFNSTSALGHNYSEVVTPATCTSSGTNKCSRCTSTTSVSALGHMFGGQNYTVVPACTTGGYTYNICTRCNEQNRFNYTNSLGHDYTVITQQATCIATGTKKCSRCTSTTPIPATGVHSYTVTSVAATCTSGGTNKCATCTATQATSALGHMFGGQTYTVVPACTTGGYTYNICSRCNEQNKFNLTSSLGHDYTVITQQATCIATGTKKCSRCTSTTSIPATGVHSYTVTSVAATCTSGGTNKCATCTATQASSALGHIFGGEPYVVPPTCTEGGYSYVLCTRCNTEKSKFDFTSAAGHSYSQVIKAPTCTTEGTNKCFRCSSTTSVPALGHMFGGEPYVVPASCEEGGYTYVLCTRCNTEKSKFDLTSAAGHSYTQVINAPTCIAEGTNKCSRCISTTSVPATGKHNYTITIKDSDCNNDGTAKCENCTATQTIPKLGHKFEGQAYTVPSSCSEEGYTYVLCSRCNTERYKFDFTAISDHLYNQVVKEPTCGTEGINKCFWCTKTTSVPATGEHIYSITTVSPDCYNDGVEKCENCTATQSISKLQHEFGGRTYVVPATCQAGGNTYVLCTLCNKEKKIISETQIVDHNYSIVIEDPSCEKEGTNKCFWCPKTTSTSATGHTYLNTYYYDETSHWKVCTTCNKPTDKVEHASQQYCPICEYRQIEAFEISISGLPSELYTDKTYQIYAELVPYNSNAIITWSSSNTSVATISSDGVVTPRDHGTVTFTATTQDGISDSIEVIVRSILVVPAQIGDGFTFPDAIPQPGSISFVEGTDNLCRIYQDNSIVALQAGEAVFLVEENARMQYYRVKVTRQEKMTKQQVINLAGPAPMQVNIGYEYTFNFMDILANGTVEKTLYNHYLYNVMPLLNGIPLDTDHSLTGAAGELPGYGEWLWMMYGFMAPSDEEIVHMLLDMAGMIPIAGTIAAGYNTYLYYVEGDIIKAMESAGVVAISFIGDAYLVKDIVKTVKYTFLPGARAMLAKASISAESRDLVLRYLDEIDVAGYTYKISSTSSDMLSDIVNITRYDGYYEFTAKTGTIFTMVDDVIPAASKSIIETTTNAISKIKAGASDMLYDIAEIYRYDGYYLLKTKSGVVFEVTDDVLIPSTRVALDWGVNGRFISEADRIKLSRWEYAPDDALYLEYKNIYDDPTYFRQSDGYAYYPGTYNVELNYMDVNKDGFLNGINTPNYGLKVNDRISRFSKNRPENDTGFYFSPSGDSYESRALAPYMDGSTCYEFIVIKPFNVQTGTIAPWWGRDGMGTQYFTKYNQIIALDGTLVDATVQNLYNNGYIDIIN